MDKSFDIAGRRTRKISHYQKARVDHFKLKNVLGDIGKTIANVAIAPVKGVADLVSKNEKIKDWGYQDTDFANDKYGKFGEGAMNVISTASKIAAPIAAGFGIAKGVGAIAGNIADKKALQADQESAMTTIPTITPPPTIADKAITNAIPAVVNNIPEVIPVKPVSGTHDTTIPVEQKTGIAQTVANVGQSIANIASKIPQKQRQQIVTAAKGSAQKIVGGIVKNNQTSPELLPKTRSSKEAEEALIRNSGYKEQPKTEETFLKTPLGIGVLIGSAVMVLIVIIVIARK